MQSETVKPQSYKQTVIYGIIMLLILVPTFMILMRGSSVQEIHEAMKKANMLYLLAGALSMFLSFVALARALDLLIFELTDQHAPFSISLNTAFIGFCFNNITPSSTGGQPMEIYYLCKRGLHMAGASMNLLVLSLFYNSLMIVTGLSMFLWKPTLLARSLSYVKYVLTWSVLFNGTLLTLCSLLILKPAFLRLLLTFVIRLMEKFGLKGQAEKFQDRSEHFMGRYENLSTRFRNSPKLLLKLFGLHVLILLLTYLVPCFVGLALGAPLSFVPDAFALQATLMLAVSGFPTPGAVGITETAFVTLFKSILTEDKVLPAMILTRTLTMYAPLLIAGFVSARAFFNCRKAS